MNSKKLMKDFTETYQAFFGSNQIVISMPLILNRCDDLFPNYSGVSIKQKIPLRFYVWIRKNNKDRLIIDKISYRDNLEWDFIQTNAMEYAPYFYDINNIINIRYKKILRELGWYDISILSELGRWKWLGFDTLISVAIVVLLNRIGNKIDKQKLQKINELPIHEVINNTYLWIGDILLESFEIDLEIQGKTFFTRKISSLLDSYYPIISFTEDTMNYDNLNKIYPEYKRFAYRLNELFDWMRDIPYFPLDWWLMYTGKPVLFEQIIWANQINVDLQNDVIKSIKKYFKGNFDNLLPIKRPRFYNTFMEWKKDEINSTFGKMMWIISLEILYFMYNLYSKWYSNYDMKLFLDALNKTRHANWITRENSSSLISFLNKFIWNIKTNKNSISVFPNDTSIMWGSVCFVMPSEGFRKTLFEAIENTKNSFNSMDLIYASWLDGIESEWLRFDQDLEKWIFSKFLNSSSCIIRSLEWEVFLSDYDSCIKNIKEWLLLDMINNKIYINGKKVTSDDLHSQSATIEIITTLLNNLGNDISNQKLPLSSYSKNKNEMLGKIVIPLIELVEKEIWKKLPLICKWSIYDFYMKLNKTDIKIFVLNKL
jgi:hypothetical protein